MLFLEIIKPQIKHLFYEFIDLFIWSILLFFVFYWALSESLYEVPTHECHSILQFLAKVCAGWNTCCCFVIAVTYKKISKLHKQTKNTLSLDKASPCCHAMAENKTKVTFTWHIPLCFLEHCTRNQQLFKLKHNSLLNLIRLFACI